MKYNKLKKQHSFLDYAVHDIRALVHSVYYKSECLKEDWDKIDEIELRGYICSISNASERLKVFTDELLNLSKFKNGKIVLNLRAIDLLSLIREVINQYKDLDLFNHSLEISFKEPNFNGAIIYADSIRLKQVLMNLLSNANKFSEKGLIIATLDKINYENKPFWHFSLIDQGKGIDEDKLKEIFKPFVQSNGGHINGSGLGLAICKEIITAHQGMIWAENNLEQGARLNFILPILQFV